MDSFKAFLLIVALVVMVIGQVESKLMHSFGYCDVHDDCPFTFPYCIDHFCSNCEYLDLAIDIDLYNLSVSEAGCLAEMFGESR